MQLGGVDLDYEAHAVGGQIPRQIDVLGMVVTIVIFETKECAVALKEWHRTMEYKPVVTVFHEVNRAIGLDYLEALQTSLIGRRIGQGLTADLPFKFLRFEEAR